jgi:hypothetical protein
MSWICHERSDDGDSDLALVAHIKGSRKMKKEYQKKAWWEWNMNLCLWLPRYASWQRDRSLDECIPVIAWLMKFRSGEIHAHMCPEN